MFIKKLQHDFTPTPVRKLLVEVNLNLSTPDRYWNGMTVCLSLWRT
jgi:hypothetical protein